MTGMTMMWTMTFVGSCGRSLRRRKAVRCCVGAV
jgi:hypothetical protein